MKTIVKQLILGYTRNRTYWCNQWSDGTITYGGRETREDGLMWALEETTTRPYIAQPVDAPVIETTPADK